MAISACFSRGEAGLSARYPHESFFHCIILEHLWLRTGIAWREVCDAAERNETAVGSGLHRAIVYNAPVACVLA